MKYKVSKYILSVSLVVFIALSLFFSFSVKEETGYYAEGARQMNMTVQQTESVFFCGESYISIGRKFNDFNKETTEIENELFDSFQFFLDGSAIEVLPENITFDVDKSISDPGDYNYVAEIVYESKTYTTDVEFTILKRKATIATLLNGKTYLEVFEGEDVDITYTCTGVIAQHADVITLNGIPVTHIFSYYMNSPVLLGNVPKQPINNYKVVASGASSDYYDFYYEAGIITVKERTVSTLTALDGENVIMMLTGTFSTLYSVDFKDLGTNLSNEEFAIASAKADAKYDDTELYDNYEKVGCYSIKVTSSSGEIHSSIPASVSILNKNLSKNKTYKVIAIYNNGKITVLETIYNDGYLTFFADDMGDFIVLEELSSLSSRNLVIILISSVIVIFIFIFIFLVFRRKY